MNAFESYVYVSFERDVAFEGPPLLSMLWRANWSKDMYWFENWDWLPLSLIKSGPWLIFRYKGNKDVVSTQSDISNERGTEFYFLENTYLDIRFVRLQKREERKEPTRKK